jgi:hypothetical protein
VFVNNFSKNLSIFKNKKGEPRAKSARLSLHDAFLSAVFRHAVDINRSSKKLFRIVAFLSGHEI